MNLPIVKVRRLGPCFNPLVLVMLWLRTFSERQDVDPPIHLKSPEKPYSVYSRLEKWAIVIIASVAGIFR